MRLARGLGGGGGDHVGFLHEWRRLSAHKASFLEGCVAVVVDSVNWRGLRHRRCQRQHNPSDAAWACSGGIRRYLVPHCAHAPSEADPPTPRRGFRRDAVHDGTDRHPRSHSIEGLWVWVWRGRGAWGKGEGRAAVPHNHVSWSARIRPFAQPFDRVFRPHRIRQGPSSSLRCVVSPLPSPSGGSKSLARACSRAMECTIGRSHIKAVDTFYIQVVWPDDGISAPSCFSGVLRPFQKQVSNGRAPLRGHSA